LEERIITDEFLRKMDGMYVVVAIMILLLSVLILGTIFEFSNSLTTIESLESATCEELMELIKNSDYGVEYYDKWIEGKCWK